MARPGVEFGRRTKLTSTLVSATKRSLAVIEKLVELLVGQAAALCLGADFLDERKKLGHLAAMTGVDRDLDHVLGRGVQARPKLRLAGPGLLIFLTITVAMGEILKLGKNLGTRGHYRERGRYLTAARARPRHR